LAVCLRLWHRSAGLLGTRGRGSATAATIMVIEFYQTRTEAKMTIAAES
jgi:hypothetical protein